MASVRIESKAFTDSRIKLLAKKLNINWHHVLGIMADLWRECTEEETYELDSDTIDALAEIDGFAVAMISARLGKPSGTKIYVSGAKGKIDWLRRMRENGKKGGRPKLSILKDN